MGSVPVLLVEDDELVRLAMRRALERNGNVVVACTCATEARAAAEKEPAWRAILVDVNLPEGERAGLDLLGALRQRWPDVPAAVVTGIWDRVISVEAEARGAVYMLKGESSRALETFLALIRPPPPAIGVPLLMLRERAKELGFTARELDVVECIACDGDVTTYCTSRKITPRTFRAHATNALAKTGRRTMKDFLLSLSFPHRARSRSPVSS